MEILTVIYRVETLEDYVQKRYGSSNLQRSIGKLSDFEYAVAIEKFKKDGFNAQETRVIIIIFHRLIYTELNSLTRTYQGTWPFISARLLKQAYSSRPTAPEFPHCYLDDLESFFWVLYWIIIHHTADGGEPEEQSLRLVSNLVQKDGRLVAMIKNDLLFRGSVSLLIKELDNGWSQDGSKFMGEFAEIIDHQLYSCDAQEKFRKIYGRDEEAQGSESATESEDPWTIIKTVIDIFDKNILHIQRRDYSNAQAEDSSVDYTNGKP
jgi:hypothetical protein